MMDESGRKLGERLILTQKLVYSLFFCIIFLGFAPLFIRMAGYNFIPSVEWISKTYSFGLIGGFLLTLIGVVQVLKRAKGMSDHELYKVIFGMIGAPILGFSLGANIVFATTPMIFALAFGHQRELNFTVIDTKRIGYRGCHSVIRLRELPFSNRDICGVPRSFLKRIMAGDRITVSGRGTEFGVFVNEIGEID